MINTDKLMIITGASSGIGAQTAALMHAAGWQVVNLSRRDCPIVGVQQFHLDLAQTQWPQEFPTFLENICKNAAQIALIHNAGLLQKDNVAKVDVDAVRRVFETNVIAAFRLNGLIIPYMQAGSSVIYIGSTLSEMGVANAATYVASKHAIAGLMKATCQDLLDQGIHTCCICPGFTDTDMLRKHLDHQDMILKMIANQMGRKRLIAPQEIAEFVKFCIENPVVNGSMLHANAGQRQR